MTFKIVVISVFDSEFNFETIFQSWNTQQVWIRFNTKDMCFYTVPKTEHYFVNVIFPFVVSKVKVLQS